MGLQIQRRGCAEGKPGETKRGQQAENGRIQQEGEGGSKQRHGEDQSCGHSRRAEGDERHDHELSVAQGESSKEELKN